MSDKPILSTPRRGKDGLLTPTDGLTLGRPLHNLVLTLPQLCVQGAAIDFNASDPEVLVALARHATDTMNTAHRSMRAIGYMMAYSAPDMHDGIPTDAVEALGWMQAEMADCAALCHYLATTALRHTADYDPPPNAPNLPEP